MRQEDMNRVLDIAQRMYADRCTASSEEEAAHAADHCILLARVFVERGQAALAAEVSGELS